MTRTCRLLLLTLALTGAAARLAHADEPMPQFAPAYATQPLVVPHPGFGSPSSQGQHPGFGCAACQADRQTGGWYQRPVGCWKSINCPGCGTIRSELTFAFGSCRRFFGDPCLKSPPPPYPYSYPDSYAPYSHP